MILLASLLSERPLADAARSKVKDDDGTPVDRDGVAVKAVPVLLLAEVSISVNPRATADEGSPILW